MDARGATSEREGEARTRGDEETYTTPGGTRVVSNTIFLTARKLNLGSTRERRHAHYPLTSCSGSHTTGLPNRWEYTGQHLRVK